jgi:hypothetical protein
MSRSRKSQSKHDAEVRSIARKLEEQGYNVKADISGYQKPDTIRGFRPDVVGTKGRERKIHEVETQDSLGSARDQKQQKAFRQAADKSKNTTFKRTIT